MTPLYKLTSNTCALDRKVRELFDIKDAHINMKSACISDYYTTAIWYVITVCPTVERFAVPMCTKIWAFVDSFLCLRV
jgi:hypothetical protein